MTVDPEQFEDLFADGVRTLFNWRRFRREGPEIRLEVVQELDGLARLYLPWTVSAEGDATGDDAALMARGSSLITVGDVPGLFGGFPAKRRKAILELVVALDVETTHVLAIPAIATPNGTLVLDGAHRLSALGLGGAPFRIALFTVVSEADAGVLIDLELLRPC